MEKDKQTNKLLVKQKYKHIQADEQLGLNFQACIPVSSVPPAPTALLRKVPPDSICFLINYKFDMEIVYFQLFQVQSESNLLKIKTRRGMICFTPFLTYLIKLSQWHHQYIFIF